MSAWNLSCFTVDNTIYKLFLEMQNGDRVLLKNLLPSQIMEKNQWDTLLQAEQKYNDYEYPKITIVLPTYNCAESVFTTLDSILEQNYPNFELIVVDASSTDHTMEIVKGLHNSRVKMISVSEYQRYEMLNKGISLATGDYINFLFPGDFYLYRETLKFMMNLALDHEMPHLVFCGTLLRDGKSDVKTLYRHLNLKLLRRGQQPTSLQSCWFRRDTFAKIGNFNTDYKLRGGFDLLCRFCLGPGLKAVSKNRILTDYDLRWVTRQQIVQHFFETMRVVFTYFGPLAALQWLYWQKDITRYLKLLSKNIKVAFLGK
jgi:glycosyltransferase involved in cell wall biosynthesis